MGIPLVEPGIVRIDAWEQFSWLRSGFSTREGGDSHVYGDGDLNLAWTNQEPQETVASNRARFLRATAGEAAFKLCTLNQLHSSITHIVGPDSVPLLSGDGKAVLRGDGLMSSQPGVMLAVQTADCVPVLVADTRKRVVAAFHAGWRGTVARIVEHGLNDMRQHFGSEPDNMIAAIGPCIGRCCFEVGEEVRTQFASAFPYAASLVSGSVASEIRPHLDLVEANRLQLLAAGLDPANISAVNECTFCTQLIDGRRKYFSHRAEAGFTGRMMSVIGLVESEHG